MTTKLEKNNNTIRYNLASAKTRFFSKLFDLLFCSIISFALGIIIFITDPSFNWSKPLVLSDGWRYLVFSLCSFTIFAFFLFLLPHFKKNQTFGKMIFKIRYYNTLPLSNFSSNLFKHELFIWILSSFISLIIGIIFYGISSDSKNIESFIYGLNFIVNSAKQTNNTLYYCGIAFINTYYILFVVLIFTIVNLFVTNRHPSFIDKFSNLYVISTLSSNNDDKSIIANKKKKAKTINYGLPGEVGSNLPSEIDSI